MANYKITCHFVDGNKRVDFLKNKSAVIDDILEELAGHRFQAFYRSDEYASLVDMTNVCYTEVEKLEE